MSLSLKSTGIIPSWQFLLTAKSSKTPVTISVLCRVSLNVSFLSRRDTLRAGKSQLANFIQITPFIHVVSLPDALDFFTRILGFAVPFQAANYAYIEREGVAIRLLEYCAGEDAPPPGNRRYAYYIDVRDVNALYDELKPKLDSLPEGAVSGPIDQEYRQRELLVLAPDGNLIVFGAAIKTGNQT